VLADFSQSQGIERDDLRAVGYAYDPASDKWNIADAAADFIFTGKNTIGFDLPGTVRTICNADVWIGLPDRAGYYPLFDATRYDPRGERSDTLNFLSLDTAGEEAMDVAESVRDDATVVLCLWSNHPWPLLSVRRFIMELMTRDIRCPVILAVESRQETIDRQLIHFSAETGALFLDGMGDGIWLLNDSKEIEGARVSGRTYLETKNNRQFINNTSFSILQATRTRISKTEYISCPSCGRTLFELQDTTARIRAVTHHLKGIKIAIMGCIVNGPGEMADADFGYVGSGPGKITLYRGKEIVKRGVDSSIAVDELISLLKESDAWIDPLTR